MHTRLRYNHWLPRAIGVRGIVLYPYILLAPEADEATATLLKHEMIHVEQIRRDGFLRFYSSYLWQFLCLFARHRSWDAAYRGINYEVEAYTRQNE